MKTAEDRGAPRTRGAQIIPSWRQGPGGRMMARKRRISARRAVASAREQRLRMPQCHRQNHGEDHHADASIDPKLAQAGADLLLSKDGVAGLAPQTGVGIGCPTARALDPDKVGLATHAFPTGRGLTPDLHRQDRVARATASHPLFVGCLALRASRHRFRNLQYCCRHFLCSIFGKRGHDEKPANGRQAVPAGVAGQVESPS
jgi:hypothetical protein